jgi:hypothetical protein
MDGGGERRAGRRVGRRLPTCLLLLGVLTLAAGSGTAYAVYDHGSVTGEYGRTGPPSSGLGAGCYLAYQQASDRLYLFADSKVYVLSRTGPGSVTPLGGAFPVDTGVTSWCGDPHLAVDDSGGATAGNFYVVPSDHDIYGFGAAGAALSSPWPVDVGAETCGVAVTDTGEVWAGNYGAREVTKFSAAGSLLGSIPIGYPLCKIAVDQTNDDLYALGYGTNVITKYSAASGYAASMTYGPVNYGNAGFALNSALDRLYVPGATIRAFDTNTGELVETTDFDGFAGSVAVDESDDTLFVSDIAHGVIKELAWGPAPEVTTAAPSFVGQQTVANGHVDPADLITVTECRFQYVSQSEFVERGFLSAKAVPCTPPTPYSNPTQVAASLPALEEGAVYHYRLVAGSGQAVRVGADQIVVTRTRPKVATGGATDVRQTAATLNGVVNVDGFGAATGCRFEIADEPAFGAGGYSGAAAIPCSPMPPYPGRVPVSATLTDLRPETTYRFRLSATNVEGSVGIGGDAVFATLPPESDEVPVPGRRRHHRRNHGPRYPRGVPCAKQACTRAFDGSVRLRKWTSPRFPASYGWLFSVHKDGKSLAHTRPAGGCISTFTGRGMIATLNGCHGRFRLTYIATGRFTVRWRVFASCSCGTNSRRAIRRAPRRGDRRSR